MRGEIILTLGGIAYRLCPTFAALAALEQAGGTGLLMLARRFAEGSCTLADVAALIRAGMDGAGETPPPDLGEQIMQAGLAALTPVLGRFLQAALTGGDSAGKA